ncbi:MAG: folylpolyglutamate synthase/dihydrofolate synthase family protein, partial [Bacteroidota bacterium]
ASYEQTLAYLFQQLPMFQRIGKTAFKKDLTNIIALCDLLEQPHLKYPVIHVAGTNGKGSTAHILAAILQAHGLKVGLYTSPHYRDFRERIKVNGAYASEQFVVDFVAQYKAAWKSIQPSFFELTVAMAFQYFVQEQVEVAIIETGLGGTLDSTNIVQPILSIITNISYDHQNMLGDTLPEIASAKAGIIKENIPVIIGEKQPAVTAVFEQRAAAQDAPLIYASEHYQVLLKHSDLHSSTYQILKNGALWYDELQVNLVGNYQQYNLQTALQAIEYVPESLCKITEKQLRSGLKDLKQRTNFIGRWQVLSERPLVLGDSAHNEAGIRAAMRYLTTFDFEQLHIVLGFAKDKDLSKILVFFPKNATYHFAAASIPRALDAKILKATAQTFGLNGAAYTSVDLALKAAKQQAKENDLIYVGGSIFVLGEVI